MVFKLRLRSFNQLLVVAMLHYPECLNKARSEIDSIVGRDRMPSFEDMNSLPYTNALIKEVLRYVLVSYTQMGFSSQIDSFQMEANSPDWFRSCHH